MAGVGTDRPRGLGGWFRRSEGHRMMSSSLYEFEEELDKIGASGDLMVNIHPPLVSPGKGEI